MTGAPGHSECTAPSTRDRISGVSDDAGLASPGWVTITRIALHRSLFDLARFGCIGEPDGLLERLHRARLRGDDGCDVERALFPLDEHALADLAKLRVGIGEFAHGRCRFSYGCLHRLDTVIHLSRGEREPCGAVLTQKLARRPDLLTGDSEPWNVIHEFGIGGQRDDVVHRRKLRVPGAGVSEGEVF